MCPLYRITTRATLLPTGVTTFELRGTDTEEVFGNISVPIGLVSLKITASYNFYRKTVSLCWLKALNNGRRADQPKRVDSLYQTDAIRVRAYRLKRSVCGRRYLSQDKGRYYAVKIDIIFASRDGEQRRAKVARQAMRLIVQLLTNASGSLDCVETMFEVVIWTATKAFRSEASRSAKAKARYYDTRAAAFELERPAARLFFK